HPKRNRQHRHVEVLSRFESHRASGPFPRVGFEGISGIRRQLLGEGRRRPSRQTVYIDERAVVRAPDRQIRLPRESDGADGIPVDLETVETVEEAELDATVAQHLIQRGEHHLSHQELIADLWAWEQENNPDQNDPLIGPDNVESNPQDLARIDGATLVAEAAGNVLLEVSDDGAVDWKALLPAHPVSTQPLKDLVGCPDAEGEAAEFCGLPPEMPAQPVPTSVAVGPDGNYYVGELTGFPGTPGEARIWKVSPDANHALCGQDSGCEQVFESRGFSAVIDVSFGVDGTFYVLELNEDGFMAAELGLGAGGTLNACHIDTESCVELATGLVFPTATTVGAHGSVYATVAALMPDADVVEIGKEFDDDNGSVHELDI